MSTDFAPGSPDLENIHKNPNATVCKKNPGLWNIVGYEHAWKTYPQDLDFLDPNSCHYRIKEYQKGVYLNLMEPFLSRLKPGSSILDVGGGIGRLAIPLARRGFKVTLVDACISNLKAAKRHAIEGGVLKNIEFFWADMQEMGFLDSGKFDAVLGIEAICYCTSPRKALKESIRAAKNKAFIFLSVEGKHGAVLADENIKKENIRSVLEKDTLLIENSTYTRYFTKESFRKMLERAGLKVEVLKGCHYGPDGIFHKAPENTWAWIEEMCSNSPVFEGFARAWFSACKVVK